MTARRRADVIVVGAGIVGLAAAYKMLGSGVVERLVVLEKEDDVGRHQSSHNSGVLHAGLYYAPGSLKARLAREGLREMVAFCRDHGIAHEQCGKLVVATTEAEVPRLRALLERGSQNGLTGLRWLSGAEMRELEPHVAGVAGVHVPEEGIVDYQAVCATLKNVLLESGAEVVTRAPVETIRKDAEYWTIETPTQTHRATLLVNCAGLHADRVARMAGEDVDVRVVPFRGEYWTLSAGASHLVRNLIYPVPDPSFPFLGVHLTRMIHGGTEAGPNAVLALAREGYRWSRINVRDIADAATYPGLWRFMRRYPLVAAYEVARSLSKSLFLRSLQRLVPELQGKQLSRGLSGVRAQVMSRAGDLVQDFVIARSSGAVHVISAPSPGATASLAIGGEIAKMALQAVL